MRRLALVLGLLAAVAASGCTTAGNTSSSVEFKGAEADVAKVVEDLQGAAARNDADRVCAELLARSLVDTLDAGSTTCGNEIGGAINEATDATLDVRDVTVTGDTATAQVRRGTDGPTATFRFVREAKRWKLAELTRG
jgi:hypothetical protein